MIFYNDEIHQVYFRGRHHVAAYLGNVLVWREDIRSLQGVEYLMAELHGDGALSPAAAARMTLALPVLGVRKAIAEAILSQLLEATLPYRWAPVCLAVAEAISITGGNYALRFPATVKLLASGAKHPEAAEAYTLALHALPHSSPTLPVTIAPPALLRQEAKAVRSRVRRLQTAFTQGFVPRGLPHSSAPSRGDIDTPAAQLIGAVTAEAGLSKAVEGEAALPLPAGRIAPELSGASHVQPLQALPVQAEINPTLIPSRNIQGALRYPFAIFCSAASLRMQLIQSAGSVDAAISVRGALGALQTRPAGAALAAGTAIKAAADAGAASCGAMDFAQSMALAAAPRSTPAEKSEAIQRQNVSAAVTGAVIVNSAVAAKMGVQISAACTAATEMPTEKTRAAMFVDGTLETVEAEDFGSLTALPRDAFRYCPYKSVYMADTVKTVGESFCFEYKYDDFYLRCSPSIKVVKTGWLTRLTTSQNNAVVDFTDYTFVPTLDSENQGTETLMYSVAKVPSTLLSQWKAAPVWKKSASKIVAG